MSESQKPESRLSMAVNIFLLVVYGGACAIGTGYLVWYLWDGYVHMLAPLYFYDLSGH